MVFVNFKRIFLAVLFILSAGTLFLGYNGLVGAFLKDPAGSGKAVEKPLLSPGGVQPVAGGGREAEVPAAGEAEAGREGFFVEYRLQRERARGRQIEVLKEIINSPSSAQDIRQTAQEQLLGISRSAAEETRVENLLKARGYRDAVVCVDQKGVSVVVDSRGFSHEEEAKIIDLVSRETGFGEQGIIVIPKNAAGF
ncbi:MAG: SpoIIIAH-like family protein [Peptococcaceae bacterium]|nr:SpoIIIAH-like family protein [Peptococcaceae bacterium]